MDDWCTFQAQAQMVSEMMSAQVENNPTAPPAIAGYASPPYPLHPPETAKVWNLSLFLLCLIFRHTSDILNGEPDHHPVAISQSLSGCQRDATSALCLRYLK